MRFIVFVLYDYYKDGRGTKYNPYFAAITAVLVVLSLNLWTVWAFLRLPFASLPGFSAKNNYTAYLEFAVFWFLPGYLILRFVFPKEAILAIRQVYTDYDDFKLWKVKWVLFGYTIISFVTLMIVLGLNH